MKNKNLRSNISDENRSKAERINNYNQGITKILLEKYKPKVIFNTDIINNRKDHKRIMGKDTKIYCKSSKVQS